MKVLTHAKKKPFSVIITLSFFLGAIAPGQATVAQTQGPLRSSKYERAIGEARQRAMTMMEKTEIPGFSIAVAVKGNIVWSEGFGIANLEHNVPVTRSTKFRLGSVSKVITAAAVARLSDAGLLKLDVPIGEYVSDLAPELGKVTTRQLTGHLGGVRHYQASDYTESNNIDFRHFHSVRESLGLFKGDPLVHKPGTRYHYSTFGYTLVSAVIEGAAKKSFLEYLDQEVLKPLGMLSTVADMPKPIISHRTDFYERGPDGSVFHAEYVDPSYKWAGGGLLSTSDDLVRFGFAHLDERFITRGTLRQMFTPLRTQNGSETSVGIGWRIEKGLFGNTIFHHEGSMKGTRSALLLYPEQEFVIAFLSNLTTTPFFAFESAQLLAEPFLEKPLEAKLDGYRPEGEFGIKGTLNGQETTGRIEVLSDGKDYKGTVTVGSVEMRIVGVAPHLKGYQLIVVHPQGGLMPFPILGDGQNLSTGKVILTGGGNFSFEVIRRK